MSKVSSLSLQNILGHPPASVAVLCRMSFSGFLLEVHCHHLAGGEEEFNWIGTCPFRNISGFTIRMLCLDLQVRWPHKVLHLFKLKQEKSVEHSDCITKCWEIGISKSEIECSPLVVYAFEWENKSCVLPVWYFLCLERYTFNNVFHAFSFQMKERKKKCQNGELLLAGLWGWSAMQEAMKE